MGELASALDALAADDLHELGAAGLLDQTAELVRVRNRIDAELARTVRVADLLQAPEHDGLRSMTAWLRGHTRLSPSAAGQVVRNGRVLEYLPTMAAAFAEGAVTAEQVTVVAPVTRAENVAAAVDHGVDLGAVDDVLAETAATRQHAQLGRVVQHYVSRLDPDGPEPDPTEARSLWLAKHSDGSLSGRFELDAVGGEKVRAALESILQADRPKGDQRTRAQQLGDAVVQLADNALASGDLPTLRTVKPHVIVMIPVDDLADPATGPCSAATGFGAQISAARARWLACDGNVSRVLSDPRASRWTWAAPIASSHHTCAGRSRSGTGTASSPAVTRRPTSAMSTMCCTGSTTVRPRSRTARCCANVTTPRSITDSGSSDHPTADGARGAPTEPRSSSDHTCSQPEPALRPGRPGRTGDYLRRSAAPEFGSER
jgi:hypothetical protein